MTKSDLIRWHTQAGIAAMQRAHTSATPEAREANERAQDMHRQAVELLVTLAPMRVSL